MSQNGFIVSSDHHANWNCLEEIFKYAKENEIPFLCGGDIIGDYNFENIVKLLNYVMPNEIPKLFLEKELSQENFEALMGYLELKPYGNNYNEIILELNKRTSISTEVENKIKVFCDIYKNENLETKTQEILKKYENQISSLSTQMRFKLQFLFSIIIEEHAKKFAELIDKYKVKTIFLNGNHEPAQFPILVKNFLKNKELIVDLGATKGLLNLNGISVAGVSNVNSIMNYVTEFYLPQEIESMFIHQKAKRTIIPVEPKMEFMNTEQTIKDLNEDFDWKRLEGDKLKELDLFISHGQIGQGRWREGKNANLMPTLLVAAKLSSMSKITVDCHLHTSDEGVNSLGIKTIRAVGNKAYLITKDKGNLNSELIEFDTKYDGRGGIILNLEKTKERIEQMYKKQFEKK